MKIRTEGCAVSICCDWADSRTIVQFVSEFLSERFVEFGGCTKEDSDDSSVFTEFSTLFVCVLVLLQQDDCCQQQHDCPQHTSSRSVLLGSVPFPHLRRRSAA